MKRKLLIGILVVSGITVAVLNPLIGGIIAAGIWIYLFRMVRKQKNSVINGQVEPKISEWHLKWLKTFLIVAALSFLVFVVGAIVHNVLHDLSEIEETGSFFIALVAYVILVVATAGGLVVFLKGRQKTT